MVELPTIHDAQTQRDHNRALQTLSAAHQIIHDGTVNQFGENLIIATIQSNSDIDSMILMLPPSLENEHQWIIQIFDKNKDTLEIRIPKAIENRKPTVFVKHEAYSTSEHSIYDSIIFRGILTKFLDACADKIEATNSKLPIINVLRNAYEDNVNFTPSTLAA